MQKDLHPKWNNKTTVTCACGNTFETGSTQQEITVDICSECHPFFTGEMRFVDVQGRVEKFQAKQEKAQAARKAAQGKSKNKKQKQAQAENPQTLKEMLKEVKKDIKPQASSKKETSSQKQ